MKPLKVIDEDGLYMEIYPNYYKLWMDDKFLGRVTRQEMIEILAELEEKLD